MVCKAMARRPGSLTPASPAACHRLERVWVADLRAAENVSRLLPILAAGCQSAGHPLSEPVFKPSSHPLGLHLSTPELEYPRTFSTELSAFWALVRMPVMPATQSDAKRLWRDFDGASAMLGHHAPHTWGDARRAPSPPHAQRPRWCAWQRPLDQRPGPRGMRLPLLLPQGRKAERLGQQHMAELPRVHCNRRPRIERTPEALRDGLIADATDPRRDLPGAAGLGQPTLQGLHAPAQGAADKHRSEEPPVMVIDVPRESGDALLIRHRGLPQVHGTSIRECQRQTDRRQPFIAVEQGAALVMPHNRTALRHEQMPSGGRVIDVGRDFRRTLLLDSGVFCSTTVREAHLLSEGP
jgi:hypothetical protein